MSNKKLQYLEKCQKQVYRWILRHFTVHNTKSALLGTANPTARYWFLSWYCPGIPFSGKKVKFDKKPLYLEKCQKTVCRWILRHFTVHKVKSALPGTTNPTGRYWFLSRYTVFWQSFFSLNQIWFSINSDILWWKQIEKMGLAHFSIRTSIVSGDVS